MSFFNAAETNNSSRSDPQNFHNCGKRKPLLCPLQPIFAVDKLKIKNVKRRSESFSAFFILHFTLFLPAKAQRTLREQRLVPWSLSGKKRRIENCRYKSATPPSDGQAASKVEEWGLDKYKIFPLIISADCFVVPPRNDVKNIDHSRLTIHEND